LAIIPRLPTGSGVTGSELVISDVTDALGLKYFFRTVVVLLLSRLTALFIRSPLALFFRLLPRSLRAVEDGAYELVGRGFEGTLGVRNIWVALGAQVGGRMCCVVVVVLVVVIMLLVVALLVVLPQLLLARPKLLGFGSRETPSRRGIRVVEGS